MDTVLLVFAKVPRAGDVKTRLTPTLTPDEAATLYEAFLHDALQQYNHLSCDVRLYFARPFSEHNVDEIPDRVAIHAQDGKGLGRRMRNAFGDAHSDGYKRAVIIGTDHPTLPTSFVQHAFAELDRQHAVCIGPTTDGGFYLLGMSTFYPQLFEGMTYSHEKVFSETLERASETGARCVVLPEWYDVDTPADLDRLLVDLERTDGGAQRTRQVLDCLEVRDRSLTD